MVGVLATPPVAGSPAAASLRPPPGMPLRRKFTLARTRGWQVRQPRRPQRIHIRVLKVRASLRLGKWPQLVLTSQSPLRRKKTQHPNPLPQLRIFRNRRSKSFVPNKNPTNGFLTVRASHSHQVLYACAFASLYGSECAVVGHPLGGCTLPQSHQTPGGMTRLSLTRAPRADRTTRSHLSQRSSV